MLSEYLGKLKSARGGLCNKVQEFRICKTFENRMNTTEDTAKKSIFGERRQIKIVHCL